VSDHNPLPPKGCTCGALWTVRGEHGKSDCPHEDARLSDTQPNEELGKKVDLIIAHAEQTAIDDKSAFADMDNNPMNRQTIFNEVMQLIAQAQEEAVNENTSDGYHTFKELYHYRMLYNAALFNEWAAQGKYHVHKSWKHHDGKDCFGGGWFVVMATLPSGQISNHYEAKDWNFFQIPEYMLAATWDGHTPEDVAKRLEAQLHPKES
jgi:hypothetical protein